MKLNKKPLLIAVSGVAGLAAAGALVAGTTFGLFSATTTGQTNTFSAGTVSFGSPGGTACTVTGAQPGDSGTCTLEETYTGTVSGGAYLALNVAITGASGTPVAEYGASTAPTAATGLYNGTATGLQVSITSGTGSSKVTYMTGTALGGTATTSGSASASATDLLVSKSAFTTSTTITWTLHWSLPSTAGNAFEGASSTIHLLVHAVQAAHNGATTSCTAGETCSLTGSNGEPAWS